MRGAVLAVFCLFFASAWIPTVAQAELEPYYIPDVTVTASTYYYDLDTYKPSNVLTVADGPTTGCTEVPAEQIGSRGMLHAAGYQLGSHNLTWYTTYVYPWEIQWIEFDLQQAYPLDETLIWNLNYPGTGYFSHGSSMKNVHVLYKVNSADDWTTKTAPGGGDYHTLAQANGLDDMPATNLYDAGEANGWGDPIQWNGTMARFVRFQTINATAGDMNWGGGGYGYVGLSKVRFYSTNVVPVEISEFLLE